MKIIDFQKKGNVVRFLLGNDDLKDWWGDDWNDIPYEYNAGTVSPQFVAGYADVSFQFDCLVMEPRDGAWNSNYSKEDMMKRKLPCIIVVPENLVGWSDDSYTAYVAVDGITKFYMGDKMEPMFTGAPPSWNM